MSGYVLLGQVRTGLSKLYHVSSGYVRFVQVGPL
jgi:hypothetical protein